MKRKRSKYKIVFKNLFFVPEYKITDLQDTDDRVFVSLKKVGPSKCPQCGSVSNQIEESYTRIVRDLDLRNKQSHIVFEENKIRCGSCGYRGIEYLEFVRPYSRCTKGLEDAVGFCTSRMPLTDAAAIWGLDWKTVKEIDKRSIQDKMIDLKTLNPTKIGVDEIANMKGHQYLTIVRDITARRVIWVGFKRKTATLDEFFTELGPEKSKNITVCCMDMWDPYIASVKKNTSADIVFDKFHIIKKVNEAVDKVRKKVFAKVR